ncbi:MAG: DUF2891 domain-containing protein [Gammaproteobacteria bacterium]|nr:DUF2891 domain-containing protein [Gammaproteobacteria bacterium]
MNKCFVLAGLALVLGISSQQAAHASDSEPESIQMYVENQGVLTLTEEGASHFAELALQCIDKEYPNKLNQSLPNISLLLSPSELHPAFFGCYDWHSSVHGHWMLVRLVKEFPEFEKRDAIIATIQETISVPHIQRELRYFDDESASWERTYGWAWLLQLASELETWDDPVGQQLAATLLPLSNYIRRRYVDFLPKQDYPIRTGVHANTAFGLSFALDYANATNRPEFATLLMNSARRYFSGDEDCPLDWEPGGEDFLSPCFEEAALMARVLPQNEFNRWFGDFLPQLQDMLVLPPAIVSDRSDGKIGHLDGLNLSRAWSLYFIANRLDDKDLATQLRGWAASHLKATLPHVASEHYEGTHWLGSFAVYALIQEKQ